MSVYHLKCAEFAGADTLSPQIQPILLSVYIVQSLRLLPFHPSEYLQYPYNPFWSFLEP